jgi:hypothetical protein
MVDRVKTTVSTTAANQFMSVSDFNFIFYSMQMYMIKTNVSHTDE